MEPHDAPQLCKPAWTNGGKRHERCAQLSGSARVGRELK